jgi:hypothetical protein
MSEPETIKTVVIANDIHKAIRVFSEEEDMAIQCVVDDLLRGNRDRSEAVLNKLNDLQSRGKL